MPLTAKKLAADALILAAALQLTVGPASAQTAPNSSNLSSPLSANPILSVRHNANGLILQQQTGTLQLQVFGDRVVRVFYSASNAPAPLQSLTVITKPLTKNWSFSQSASEVVLRTKAMQVKVNRKTGAVSFLDLTGKTVLAEKAGARELTPSTVGELKLDTLRSSQGFVLAPDEAIFGLGQHQDGQMNYRGKSVHLQQKNTDVAVPVLVSSRGYGVLWDNPAVTDVNVGELDPGTLTWTSEAAKSLDYYFFYGPELDDVISGYRNITGAAPLFAKYAYGLWQSRERYTSEAELKDVVAQYRENKIPLDGIIQDWQYWNPHPWGSHQFDEARYPDPKRMMSDLHADNIHMLISVWPKFDVDSPNAEELRKAGAVYPEVIPYVFPAGQGQWYDPFKPAARELYWKQMSRYLFSAGLDGWWLDGSEVELSGRWGEFRDFKTGMGPGAEVYNAYPLMHTTAVYQGQRAETDKKRVYILTRSAFAGQQRNGATTWSGDIRGTWDVLQHQVPAGINFSMSGIPYWNTDTGGFFGSDLLSADYRELFTRWFQYSTFCPMLRIHGTNQPKEIWRFSGDERKILTDYDKLRYHLLPYVYSTAWQVTHQNSTMMRGLAMDFRQDPKVYNVPDQFLFGPNLMACPVTSPLAGQNEVVPAERLMDAQGNAGGLTGTYYNGENFETKILERKDASINFNWPQSPAPGVGSDDFSVRWEGSILTGPAGTYRFALGADDGMRLWVNGKLLVEDWASRAYVNKTATIDLPANTKVPIKVEYYDNLYGGQVDLKWTEPGGSEKLPTRAVYLPSGTTWTDFWTGQTYKGGQSLKAAAPLETMPLFVKAGAILPYGPEIQYANEKTDPIEIRVYQGADGAFTLYEDEGDSYNYEKGLYSTIPMSWNEKSKTLRFGARVGKFPGMPSQHTFRVVWVKPGQGVGIASSSRADVEVVYSGKTVSVRAE